jgi:hypothetical protein
MRPALAVIALAVAAAAPAAAQTPAPQTSPAAADAPCTPRQANLGGIGRAGVVAFIAPVSRAPVCATFANVAFDGYEAHLGDAPAPDFLIAAAVIPGGNVTLPLEGATLSGVGPYAVAPGGTFPDTGGDISEAPRVVLAFAGQRVLLIATSAVELVDLTRVLRNTPDLFGADAVERAVVIASGPNAALALRSDDGLIGAPSIATAELLWLSKR